MQSKKHGKKASGALMAVLYGLLVVMFIGIFFMTWSQMLPICETGNAWFYFSLAGISALALSIFGSVFMTQTQLYDAKDNELLLSMPIRPRTILLSRMAVLLIMTALFVLITYLPACVLYAVTYGVTPLLILGWLVSFVGLVLLSQAICCALGWMLHKLLSRMRNKAIASMIYMVLFLAAYFYFYTNAQNIMVQLLTNADSIAAAIQHAWPLYAVGAASLGDPLQILLFALLAAVVFFVVIRLLSMSFIKTVNGGHGTKGAKRRIGKNNTTPRRPVVAVMHKELRRFLTSSVYLTNMGLGVVFAVALPVAAAVFRGQIVPVMERMPILALLLPALVAAVEAFIIATGPISAPSVSLEGQSLWVMRSMPISGKTILRGKLLFHCVMMTPVTTVSAAVTALVLGCGALEALAAALFSVVFSVFVGIFGLVMNMTAPRFDWVNEAWPCKQSMVVMITIFGSYFIVIALAFLLLQLLSVMAVVPALLICEAIVLAVDIALYFVLFGWGAKRIEALAA